MEQVIHDSGDLRKYRTELPNLYDDMALDPYQFRLLAHYKRVCGADDGRAFEGTRTTAEHCNMSAGKVSEARTQLAELGLIAVERDGQRLVVTIEDIWAENFQEYAGGKDNQDGGATKAEGRGEEVKTAEEPAAEANAEGNDGVHAQAMRKDGRPKTDSDLMFEAICEVCGYDYEIISKKEKARVGRVSGKLLGSSRGYTPEDVLRCYGEGGWWYKHDWRGKSGDRPTPEKIQATLAVAVEESDKGASKSVSMSSDGIGTWIPG